MIHSCASPISWDTWVAYFAAELDEAAETRVEEQLFGCAHCADEASALLSLTEALGRLVPPVLDDAAFSALSGKGAIARIVSGEPNDVLRVPFTSKGDLVVCELKGDFAKHPRVDVALHMDRHQERLLLPNVSVRADGRGLWLACQLHNVTEFGEKGQIIVHPVGADTALARYELLHEVHIE